MIGIHPEHLRLHVIRPTLQRIDAWSSAAENLVLGTAAQESRLGHYLIQLNGGPARGIYQMEPATHADLYENYLAFHAELQRNLLSIRLGKSADPEEMVWNLRYATAMCRIHYLRVREPLPDADNIEGLAKYWKRTYNTELGAGTVTEFCKNYLELVRGT